MKVKTKTREIAGVLQLSRVRSFDFGSYFELELRLCQTRPNKAEFSPKLVLWFIWLCKFSYPIYEAPHNQFQDMGQWVLDSYQLTQPSWYRKTHTKSKNYTLKKWCWGNNWTNIRAYLNVLVKKGVEFKTENVSINHHVHQI